MAFDLIVECHYTFGTTMDWQHGKQKRKEIQIQRDLFIVPG
jgi:hypothetical protein